MMAANNTATHQLAANDGVHTPVESKPGFSSRRTPETQ